MKVFIVLEYFNFEGMYETCRVDRVYASRKKAEKRVKHLQKLYIGADITFHVIQKTLKGYIGSVF